jgi:dihydroorotase
MDFTKLTELELPAAFDAHVHLRDGEMSQLVTPTIRQGGVNQVYVMVRYISLMFLTNVQESFSFTFQLRLM